MPHLPLARGVLLSAALAAALPGRTRHRCTGAHVRKAHRRPRARRVRRRVGASVMKTIDGPIVLVGHSYGGAVITEAAGQVASVKALV
jgi:thioesterase domain-containing protein